MRTFISIDFTGKVAERIQEIQKQLPEFRGKLTEPENLHLTLKFLGDVDEETLEKVKERLKQVKFRKFFVSIEDIGVISPKFIKIIGLHIKDCTQLHKEIDAALAGLFPEETRFVSHVTIARVKGVENKDEFLKKLDEVKFEAMNLQVGGFELKESILTEKKPEYKTLEEFNLS